MEFIDDPFFSNVAGGSADPALNTSLFNVLRKAKVAGVPKENIEKAIVRVSDATFRDMECVLNV